MRSYRGVKSQLAFTVAALALVAATGLAVDPTVAAQPTGCRFLTDPNAVPAFCDTFDAPGGNDSRTGDLDGVVWGVSRATSYDNPPQGAVYNWAATQRETCGVTQLVQPEKDVAICNGHMVEAVNDNSAVTLLAAYPKQPFDIAGRTGVVSFDVSGDSLGPHTAWTTFTYTDQPVPAPYGGAAGVNDFARNSFGFSLAKVCGESGCGGSNNPPGALTRCLSVDQMFITVNYQQANIPFQILGCVLQPSVSGQLNHVEVRLSETQAQVWATDPDGTGIREIAQADNVVMPLTRGLIWIEDVHYNAEKCFCNGPGQRVHTIEWDNVAFDGPVLARDLGFDVPDANKPGPKGLDDTATVNLGYYVPGDDKGLTVEVPGVTNVAQAAGALVTLTYWPHSTLTLNYRVNGNPWHAMPWPYGPDAGTYVSQTIGMPLPVEEVRNGPNSLQITTSDRGGISVANIDLILVGGGGVPSSPGPIYVPTAEADTVAVP